MEGAWRVLQLLVVTLMFVFAAQAAEDGEAFGTTPILSSATMKELRDAT